MDKLNANGTDIYYDRHEGTESVVLLHGWGASSAAMRGLFDCLSRLGCDVVNVDLPGFGDSPAPPESFGVEDYAECVRQLITRLGLKDVTLIGHSFGGRLSILLGAESFVKRIVLVSSAGIKPRRSLKKWLRIRAYKRAVRKGQDVSKYGSRDYKALAPQMKRIFVRVVNRHLDKEVGKITVPTLLIWGKNDTETPLYMAKRIKRRVKDCGLVTLEGGHFAYVEQAAHFYAVVKAFLGRGD